MCAHSAGCHRERVGVVGVLGPDDGGGGEADVGDDVAEQVGVVDEGAAWV